MTPLLWLYATYGLGLEAHQQNTLVTLDTDGWPTGGHYRDNQGYYFSPARSHALHQWIPGAGRDLGTYVDDTVIDERLGYYIGINNILGTIGALGSQGLADETDLLADTDRHLATLAAQHGDRLALATTLREAPTLRCKANLLTRIRGMDELIGPSKPSPSTSTSPTPSPRPAGDRKEGPPVTTHHTRRHPPHHPPPTTLHPVDPDTHTLLHTPRPRHRPHWPELHQPTHAVRAHLEQPHPRQPLHPSSATSTTPP
ncbi:IucA/IucC family C-terminal-domain containing protein [Streptomyces sp. MNU89]|uniref:IucA/IucC family C-terminal-domain containing protein n=1 Tax=Streptomyces sp. MNU89 TaxID=2560025 RepID=UPI001E301843|nr:IucA/IucC family C-terminal-domain containing protein [Streptomyces sp. MNU89]MCC9742140.1 hypothetical protein [Streptomyces sp. MNU89]